MFPRDEVVALAGTEVRESAEGRLSLRAWADRVRRPEEIGAAARLELSGHEERLLASRLMPEEVSNALLIGVRRVG